MQSNNIDIYFGCLRCPSRLRSLTVNQKIGGSNPPRRENFISVNITFMKYIM